MSFSNAIKFLYSLISLCLLSLISACGGSNNDRISAPIVQAPLEYQKLEFVAGRLGGRGNADGLIGRFTYPSGIAINAAGLLYVSDDNGGPIRTIMPSGIVGSLAGTAPMQGYIFGYGEPSNDYGLTLDPLSNLYVVDKYLCQIRKVTPNGDVSIFAGKAGCGYLDGDRELARFGRIHSIVMDRRGIMYIADTTNYVIRKIDAAGVVSTFAGQPGVNGLLDGMDERERFFSQRLSSDIGKVDGKGAAARFLWPKQLALDGAGGLFVSDGYKVMRKITPVGEVTTLLGRNEDGSDFYFKGLGAMVGDSMGNLFVFDEGVMRKISPMGTVSLYAGGGRLNTSEGSAEKIEFAGQVHMFPYDEVVGWIPGMLAIDKDNNLYYANSLKKIVSKISPDRKVSTIAGVPELDSYHYLVDGRGAAASFTCRVCWDLYLLDFEYRVAMAADSLGNLYVNDTYNLRKVSPGGDVSTIESAYLSASDGGVITKEGIRYWIEYGRFYKLDPKQASLGAVHIAGDGSRFGNGRGRPVDGLGSAAVFYQPIALTVDNAGNAYIIERDQVSAFNISIDGSGPRGSVIRKITPEGQVTTIAGNFDQYGYVDGAGLMARFQAPSGLAVDKSGNIFVADTSNHVIRKIDKLGVVSTFAGTPTLAGSQGGNIKRASFKEPTHLVFDSVGNLYVADNGNYLIRKITPSGQVSTVAGKVGMRGVLPGPLPATISSILGMTIDANDTLYIFSEYSVLKLTK